MNIFRHILAAASLTLLALPLPFAAFGAWRLFSMTPADASALHAGERVASSLTLYSGAILIGFLGMLLTGVCLDGLRINTPWYVRSLAVIGILWLFYYPIGTLFGAGLLAYLMIKRFTRGRSMKRLSATPQVHQAEDIE